MLTKLKLADGLLYAEKDGKHLFLQTAIPDWIVVNTNGAILLSRCDGKTSFENIVGRSSTDSSIACEAKALFCDALARGVLADLTSVSIRRKARPDTHYCSISEKPTLRAVYLRLTNQCNLHCTYCYAGSGSTSDRLSSEDLFLIAKNVASLSKSVEFVLSGGEPLLNPFALDFAEAVKNRGNVVQILTNGTLIDAGNADRISAVADLIKISLDGSNENVHSATRGNNNFRRVIRAIDLLAERGANVLVAMTVTKKNRDNIPAMVTRFGPRLTLQPLFKAGRGEDKNDLSITGAEYYEALASVDGVAPMGMIGRALESIRGCGVRRCALAEREISISECGDVFPCQLLHAPQFKAGNIHDTCLTDIYYDSPIFNQLRSVTVDSLVKCSTCQIRLICGGACRARDFYEVGSIEQVGDFCEYEKRAFINGIFESVDLLPIVGSV